MGIQFLYKSSSLQAVKQCRIRRCSHSRAVGGGSTEVVTRWSVQVFAAADAALNVTDPTQTATTSPHRQLTRAVAGVSQIALAIGGSHQNAAALLKKAPLCHVLKACSSSAGDLPPRSWTEIASRSGRERLHSVSGAAAWPAPLHTWSTSLSWGLSSPW